MVSKDRRHLFVTPNSLRGERFDINLAQVTILESSERVGGRILTYYGHGWYGDLGPMRFPPTHLAVRKYVLTSILFLTLKEVSHLKVLTIEIDLAKSGVTR